MGNPELSWLWLLALMLMLADSGVVQFIRLHFKNFAVPYFEPALVLHNTPTLHRMNEFGVPWVGETITLRGRMWWEGRLQWKTHVAQTYIPPSARGVPTQAFSMKRFE